MTHSTTRSPRPHRPEWPRLAARRAPWPCATLWPRKRRSRPMGVLAGRHVGNLWKFRGFPRFHAARGPGSTRTTCSHTLQIQAHLLPPKRRVQVSGSWDGGGSWGAPVTGAASPLTAASAQLARQLALQAVPAPVRPRHVGVGVGVGSSRLLAAELIFQNPPCILPPSRTALCRVQSCFAP